MTIHKKGTVSSKMKNTGTAKNELATTSTSSDVATTETVEVSSTSIVKESNRVKESESKSSMVEITSGSREVITDSKGNIIKVIETPPQTVQSSQSSSSRRTGKGSQDFITGEQMQSIKQAKTMREIPREHATSLSKSHTIQGGTTERSSQSVQAQNQSASRSKVQQSSSSNILIESSSASEDHRGHRSTVVISHDIKNGTHAPVIQTSSRSTKNTNKSSETSEAVTKDGQTVSSITKVRETEGRIDDNGGTMSTSSREIDRERTVTPSKVAVIKNTDDIKRTAGDKGTHSDSKSERSNVKISTRCNKPGQSTWDGTFVYEKPPTPKGKSAIDKTVSANSKIHGDTKDSETSVKVTEKTSSTEVVDQIVSSSSSVTRDSKTAIEGQRSATHLRDITLEKADATDFAGEKYPKGPARHSKPGDSTWDGSFVVEKIATQSKQRNDSDIDVFRGRSDNAVETTQRRDFKEKNADGTYQKESSETMRVVRDAVDSTRFISEERRDVSKKNSIHVDGKELDRVSSPSQRKVGRLGESAWNGEFICEKSQDDVKKHPSDVTVVRRTEKYHDSVDVQDVSEEQNISSVSESVSASYIVEYAISGDKKNVEKVTSVSEVILEEDGPEDKIARTPRSPERQAKLDTTSRCYKPGQSAWDGTFVYERPVTPDSRRRPEDRRTVKTVDIRDVTEDNSVNEADVTSTSYIVEHSSSQQSFSDVRDASTTATMYETVVYEGRPVETTIRFDDTSRSKVTERRTSPSPRPRSPEKTPKDRDLRSSIKPGSSTWDGTFVLEKSQEKKRSPSRESIDNKLPDKPRPADSKKTPLVDTSKKYVSEAAIDLRDITRDVSSTSEIVESSVVMEQSRMHESYMDSSNLDYSTTSVETVIIRDGQPVTTQKTVTIQESPHSLAKNLLGSDVITTTTDVKESTVKSLEKKESHAGDRSYRPLKPGSSTWDGSFVYEKREPEERKPSVSKKPSKDALETVDKGSPIKGKLIDDRTVTIFDTSKNVTSAADYSTSSVTIERTFVTDSETCDSSNISKTFIKESAGDKVYEVDYEKPSRFDGKPKPSPRQRPEDAEEPKYEKPQKSPVDRTHRPSKPGASAWDGSFVYERSEEKRSEDRKIPKDTLGTIDKRSPIKEKPSDIADHKTSITILNTSKDMSSSADYSTSFVTVEQTYVADSEAYDSSNISKIFIKESSKDKVHPIDYERSRQPSDEKPKPSPRKRPDTVEPKDEKPQKSPDRTHRPSKPGASTWDGSFVYEKPQDSRKKPTDEQTDVPKKPADERKPIGEGKEPVARREKPMPSPILRKPTDKETQRDVTEIRHAEDVADITRADITRTSEVLQQSSHVIDQSSRFTSVQDVRDVKDERVITEFTTDARKDVRDVTESTKKFIDKEQVTSMVARDVVDDTRFDTITGSVPRSPADSTRKSSPERPGYPRGIPGLREDDRPKPIPTAGKPSRPVQRERSPQQPAEHGRPSEVRPKSPEKFRDYTSPTRKPQPAAGKSSRPEEKSTAPRKSEKESGPTKPMEKKPAVEPKSSRFTEKSEKPKISEQDKPKRGDQSPDSLDEDVVYSKSMLVPDILSKIPLKEQCICELCTCGRHRCPHNLPQEHLEFPHEEPVPTVTSYRQDYDEKRVEKQTKYYHKDYLRTEGEFIGERRTDYVATKGERAPVRKPEDHLKPEGEFVRRPKEEAPTRGERAIVKKPEDNLRPEGEFVCKFREEALKYGKRAPISKPQDNLKFEKDSKFDTTTTTELVFTGIPGKRPIPIRRNTYTKIEGDFIDETTTRSQYIDHRSSQRAELIKQTDNLTVGEGEFTGTSHIKEDFQTHVIEREPQWRPKYSEDTDRFYSKTDITDSTTTSQEQFRTFDQTDYKSTTVIRRADNLRPEGPFEALPHTKDDYITPILLPKPEPQKPKDNLKPEGPFEGRPKDDYSPKRGERYEVKRPEDNLRPEGPFEGRPKDDYKPIRGERADVKRPEDNLKPEGLFQGRPKDDFTPKTAERPEVKRPKDNLRPEGDFTSRPRDQYIPVEKRTPIRHPDNLYPEGDFERPELIPYGPGDRASVVRHPDNLFPIGEFPDREIEPFRPAERRTPIKHDDNLRPEGDFVGRPKDDYRSVKGERADVKRPEDNLRPEGLFEGRPKDDYSPKRAERPEVKRPEDNLRPEGDFERPEKAPIGPAERRTPIKHRDNLRPEGEFERPRQDDYRPAEKPEVKKPIDNLRPEGEFERPRPGKYAPAEKRTPVKYPDNLKPEGEFIGKPKEDFRPTKGVRVDVKRPEDNLRPEGSFEGRPKDDYLPKRAERPEIKRPEDNLRPEGPFEIRPKDDYKPTKGERADVRRPEDNLRPEGPFEGRPKDDYLPKRAERPEVKRPEDNLRPEGDFERPEKAPIGPAERRTPIKYPDNLKPEGKFIGKPKEDFIPMKGDRADVKRPEDNLRPEGPFEGRPKDDYRPVHGERMDIVKRTDNLRMEGDIETYRSRDEYTDFLVRERTEVTKYQDNLRMEGEFIDARTRDDFKVVKGERMDVIKHHDNLRPEGPFEGRSKDDYLPKKAEKTEIKKPKDNLKPEGDFVRRPKEEMPKKGDRADVKKPKDNLRPEGDFERPEKKPISPAERRSPIKHSDNLKPEGEFERPKPEEFKPAERPVIKKPHDNLKPEGEFVSRPKEEAPKKGDRADIRKPQDNLQPEGDFERPEKKPIGPAERRSPIKHSDNLKPEGEFERPKPEEFKPAERPVVKKPHDNLKPEGEFVSRSKEEAPKKGDRADIRKPQDNLQPEGDFERPEKKPIGPAERRSPIKHSDNLKPEGEFERPKPEEFKPAERPVVKKPHDNLKPEGEFVSRPKEEAPKKGDRVDIRKPQDNLRPEGDFERPEKKPIGPAERRTPIKHTDNLKPEGEFMGKSKEEAPRRGDRADVKRPMDNLKPEGKFERPEKVPIRSTEKRKPIKHPDNLRPEGEFEKRPKEKTPIKGERADVTRPKDNLRPEGEFERPQKSPIGLAERRTPIRHEDNLHPEGEFVGRPKDDFIPKRVDRPIQKKPKDNLKPEGEFTGKVKDDYKPTKGERTEIVMHEDNLKMEGDIDIYRSRDDYMTTSKRERVDIVHREDNLKIEGEFVDIHRRDDYRATRGERSEIIRHEDNLYPEGDFERPEKAPVGPAERRSPIKHPDNLKSEGDFVQRPKEIAPIKGDRAVVKKPKDNLKPEGEFERPTKSFVSPGERRSPIKQPDNLHPEGEFIGRPKKDTPLKGDRADVKKPKDNLHPEGEFVKRSLPKKVGPAERRTPIKHKDNLHPEGDFYIIPKDDFTPKRGDRSPVKKPQDNLRPEGEMDVSPKDDYKYVNGERMEVRRHEDHLRMEGQMDIHRSRDDYKKITKVEKVDVKRHEDNLRMEGEFIDVRRKDDYVHVIGERVPIKKHPDNLHPEGDFDRPQKTVISPAEKRSPIRHADNLKPEGDFIGRPRDDFTPKRAERAEIVKREDNLKMTGGFEGTTSHKSTYTMVRGERADIKSHEDNLKISTDTMETKTTTRDTYTPSKREPSPADKTVNHRRHMESSISLGDDTTMMTTTKQRNYNTYTKRVGKDIAAKMSQMESDTRKTAESQTLADGTVVTSVRRATTSAQSDQRANAQTVTHHQQTQYVTDRHATQSIDVSPSGLQPMDSRKTTSQLVANHEQHQRTHLSEQQNLRFAQNMQNRRTIEDRSIAEGLSHRGQIVRGEDTSRYAIDATHSELHRQQQQQHHVERHHQEITKRDYVNAQHMESRQKSATKQHEQHTISSQARYNSSSPEFRQTTVERSQLDSAAKFSHHRKNVISSSSADVTNAVLHRRGAASSTEALHTISSTAADQRKSISNLAESGQYISNSTQSSDRRSLTSLHRSSKEVNPWASSSYERPQRIVRQDNLTVGGKFYSQSEARSYGNFSQNTQKVERVQRQTNASHINLGDDSTVKSSMYKREYVPRHRGPCPAALLEAKQAPFKHIRDTQKHKFYMPVVSN